MTRNDLITYLVLREKQHRGRAIHAVRSDTITFHLELAAVFGRLVEETQVQDEPVIDAIAGAPNYLNW